MATAARRVFASCGLGASAGFWWSVSTRAASRVRCEEAGDARVPGRKTWGVPWVDDWDNPSERGLPTQSRSVKRQLVLIRHGQYEREKSAKSDSEQTLTELGRLQAEETGKYLARAIATSPLFRTTSVSAVHVSDLTRAQQTCSTLIDAMGDAAPKLTPAVDPLLREIFPCDPQPPYPKKARPESERIAEAAFSKYFHRPTRDESSVEVVVCHANVIRYFLCRALQVPPEAWLRFSLPHCSLTMISIDGKGRVSVGAVGAASHLAPEHQSVANIS
uniref:Serine/threonine-protein phosphatase PGAM5, mitochondrial n=2 Tax=Neobodo designis TaxID=312471 RepID=A0A7S1MIX5_NEODS